MLWRSTVEIAEDIGKDDGWYLQLSEANVSDNEESSVMVLFENALVRTHLAQSTYERERRMEKEKEKEVVERERG